MHRGGISPRGRGGGRSGGRGGPKRGGGHPSGLSGKDIGLWYARRGKAKKEKLDIQNRSVVTLNKRDEAHLTNLLNMDTEENEQHPTSQPDLQNRDETSSNLFFIDKVGKKDKANDAVLKIEDDVYHPRGDRGHGRNRHFQRGAGPRDPSHRSYGTRPSHGYNYARNNHQQYYDGSSNSMNHKQSDFHDGRNCTKEEAESCFQYYESLVRNYGSLFVSENSTKADLKTESWRKDMLHLSGEHLSELAPNHELEGKLKDELNKKQSSRKFNEMLAFRKKLPSYQMKEEILGTIERSQVCVISGETGCGKTTQVAQFILDDCIEKGKGSTCHVICTQPRRISAISVAERVAEERDEVCGQSCGYQIRLENKLPRNKGSILYCTTGILLQRLVNDPYMTSISHVILDEIHERDILSDFLLIIIKDVIPFRPDLKVILMSATLNAEMFSCYFGNCPMLHIPGFTFPVKEYILEDIIQILNYRATPRPNQRPKYGKKWRQEREEQDELLDYVDSLHDRFPGYVLETLSNMEFKVVDLDLILELVIHICHNLEDGAILIFLPGWTQITKMHDLLTKHSALQSNKYLIIPLHSMLPTVNQKEIFNTPAPGIRKIVIATTIAETSITIPDVVYVINGGKSKEKTYDVDLNVSGLMPVWCSKASARQRKGRAGRVKEGICYHLFTNYHWEKFDDYTLPEILRTPLDSLGLQIKLLRLGMMKEFLQKAMQPPDEKAIDNAIQSLVQMGAFDENEQLTALGYHLAKLPVAPKVGRMILFGAIFSCIDPVLTIAASLDFKEPFYIPLHKEKEAGEKRLELSEGSQSDHVMLVNAFMGWEEARKHGDQRQYCWTYFLSESTLKMIEKMKKQFAQLLYDIRFLPSPGVKDYKANHLSNNLRLVKAIVCAGLYPNVVKANYGPAGKKPRPPKLTTEQYGRVTIHPKSVNQNLNRFESPWLVYHQLMKTTNLFVHDCSVVTPFALLFFGGVITVHQEQGMDTIQVDTGIKFHSPVKMATLVKRLRHELDSLLSKKILNPSMELFAGANDKSHDTQILEAIIELITSEEVKAKVYVES